VHLDKDGLLEGDMELGGQLRQVVFDDEPFSTEYLPASHTVQFVRSLLPDVSRYVPGGQLRHVVFDGEPMVTEYLPST
jgi:hypothetical protein